jgi:hypothetical protein
VGAPVPGQPPGAGVIVDLVTAAEAVDTALARRLAGHLLAWPGTYSLDRARSRP